MGSNEANLEVGDVVLNQLSYEEGIIKKKGEEVGFKVVYVDTTQGERCWLASNVIWTGTSCN